MMRQRTLPIQSVRPGRDSLWLAVESVDAPGNLGTIIRTAEATGISGIFMVGPDADPYDPAAVRASMGSLFSQRVVRCSKREFTDWAREFGVAIVGSSPAGLLDYRWLPMPLAGGAPDR